MNQDALVFCDNHVDVRGGVQRTHELQQCQARPVQIRVDDVAVAQQVAQDPIVFAKYDIVIFANVRSPCVNIAGNKRLRHVSAPLITRQTA